MSDFQKLIDAHNGDMALLYIWKYEKKSDDLHQASRELCISVSRLKEADELLREIGIVFQNGAEAKKPHLLPAEEEHQYSSQDITAAMKDDSSFRSVVDFTEQTIGKVLTKDDLNKLLDIYSNLGMPPEVMYVLITYCRKMSEGQQLRMRYVSTVAYEWANLGINTADEAEKLADKRVKMKNRVKEILSIIGADYKLTPGLKSTIENWIEKGVTDDIVESAYESTIRNTGKCAWTYLDKVVLKKIEEAACSNSKPDNRLPTTVFRG